MIDGPSLRHIPGESPISYASLLVHETGDLANGYALKINSHMPWVTSHGEWDRK